jgi:hypothetical protein
MFPVTNDQLVWIDYDASSTQLLWAPLSSELSVSEDSLGSHSAREGEEFKSPLQTPLSPSRPETVMALDIMRSALSGSTMTLSPMHQQQVIAEIKAEPTFIDECQLTPQKVFHPLDSLCASHLRSCLCWWRSVL